MLSALLVSPLKAVFLFLLSFSAVSLSEAAAESPRQQEGQAEVVELATYMTTLQVLTHKLSLSIAHDNAELAEFYRYEPALLIEEIKEKASNYNGLPIAVLMEQIADPAYVELKEVLSKENKSDELKLSRKVMAGLIQSCNQCHRATQHGFIKITDGSSVNPFNQEFTPGP